MTAAPAVPPPVRVERRRRQRRSTHPPQGMPRTQLLDWLQDWYAECLLLGTADRGKVAIVLRVAATLLEQPRG